MATDKTTELDRFSVAIAGIERDVDALLDAYFPGRKQAREEESRRGYLGARCGWYPERPRRRRKRAQ